MSIRIKRIVKSFLYAWRGIFRVWREEQNLRVQSAAGAVVIILAFLFKISVWEWCFLLLAVALVIITETINSAIERIIDLLKPRLDSLVKEIKDIMAAAVLLASLFALTVGLLIFGPRCLEFFSVLK